MNDPVVHSTDEGSHDVVGASEVVETFDVTREVGDVPVVWLDVGRRESVHGGGRTVEGS